jgi:prepilin-type N-terminal cleavage/methylation domain-containing protein
MQKTFFKKSARGFTLIEILLALGISATVIVITSAILVLALGARAKSEALNEAGNEGRQATEVIAQTIRNAESISTPADGASGNSLELAMLSGAQDPTTIELRNGKIMMKEGNQDPVALTGNKVKVDNLTFRNLSGSGSPGIVQVEIDLQAVNPQNLQSFSASFTFQTSAALR